MKRCTKKTANRALKLNEKSQRATTHILSLDHIIRNRSDFNLNPPYQRGEVWKDEQKEKFIHSLILGRQIGSIHLVVNDPDYDPQSNQISGIHKDVLDAKQRLHTLFEFIDNKFGVAIDFGDGTQIWEYTYSDFQQGVPSNEEHTKRLSLARKAIFDLQVTISNYPPMPLKSQIQIFEDVNTSMPLVGNEKMYARYCFLKLILQYLFDSIVFPALGDHFHKQIADNRRYSGLRLIHSILFLAFGKRYDGDFQISPYSAKALEHSASLVEPLLIENKITSNTSISDEVIESLGEDYAKTLKTFRDAVICTSIVASYNGVSKKHDVNLIMDLIVFFCYMLRRNETKRHVQDSVKEFFDMADIYAQEKKKQNLKAHTTEIGLITKRFAVLDDCYAKCVTDTGQKNKGLSCSDKTIASFRADGTDPLTGADLGLNPDYDHVSPKSCHSTTKVVAMSSNSNRVLKGATTLQTAQAIVDLHDGLAAGENDEN